MKSRLLWLGACALVCSLSAVGAAAEGERRSAQADPAAACAKQAKGLKGDEHQKAVNDCLKANGGNGHSQQNKMKYCNAEAGRKDLHGDQRRAFMSNCLKG